MADLGSPTSYLALSDRTPVYASGGEEIGRVEHVLAVPEDDIFDGLVLDTPHGKRFADASLVAEIYERGVALNIDAGQAADLPEPTPSPGAMEADPADGTESALHDKLRRAWALISGNY